LPGILPYLCGRFHPGIHFRDEPPSAIYISGPEGNFKGEQPAGCNGDSAR